jgi:hypothetical protein
MNGATMTDQLPAVLQAGVLFAPADTYVVPALIAEAGQQAGWRYVEFLHRQHQQPAHAPRLRPGLRALLRLV